MTMQRTININGHKIKLRVNRKNGGFIRGVATDNRGNKLVIPGLFGPTLTDAQDSLFVAFVKQYGDDS